MTALRFLLWVTCMIGIIILLTGCGTPPSTPVTIPTLPPPPPEIPKTTVQPILPPEQPALLRFIQTVQVTPDSQYLTGAFVRINFIPATDRFVVTFGGDLAQPVGECTGKAYSFKMYTIDLHETGESGTFSCDISDAGSVMVDNTYYFAAMITIGDQHGWHMLKIDAVNWKTQVDKFFAVDWPTEGEADPMMAYINGKIDLSSGYNTSGNPHNPDDLAGTYGTHHQFFSNDLEYLGKKILTDPGHVHGSYIVFVDGINFFVTADSYDGDVIVAKYNGNWEYLGGKTLIHQAHFSTGLVYDGQRFYLAYTDTSQRFGVSIPPVALNIRLAVFDRDWNLLEDVAVTDFVPEDGKQPGRPWVILHGNRLYVSYDVDTANHETHEEDLKWQSYVSVYELTRSSP